jgi:hypothetical protein
MSDLVPSGNDPDAGLSFDIGVSLHEWITRWAEIEDMRPDGPAEALEEAMGLLDEMFRELAIPREGPSAPETEDIVRSRENVVDVVNRWRADEPVDQEEIDDAFDAAREVFQYLTRGRREDDEVP